MKTSEILIAAKALIDTPKKWTQEAVARDAVNYPVESYDEDAVCFCSVGALCRLNIDGDEGRYIAESYLTMAAKDDIVNYNDTHTHSEVMVVWDKAIELAKKDEETNV